MLRTLRAVDVPHHCHSDHISLLSSLGDLKDTCQFPLWANGEGEVRILVRMEWSAEGEILDPVMSSV